MREFRVGHGGFWGSRELSLLEKLCLGVISTLTGQGRFRCYFDEDAWSAYFGISRAEVQHALETLRKRGWIGCTGPVKGRQTWNLTAAALQNEDGFFGSELRKRLEQDLREMRAVPFPLAKPENQDQPVSAVADSPNTTFSPPNPETGSKYLTLEALEALCGISKNAFWKFSADCPDFPKNVNIPNDVYALCWDRADVENWIKAHPGVFEKFKEKKP